LKQLRQLQSRGAIPVPPGLTAGGGLKPKTIPGGMQATRVPPGLTAGGGLKQRNDRNHRRIGVFPPASPPGAD